MNTPSQSRSLPDNAAALLKELRQLFDKTAEAHEGDYASKVDNGLVAVYAFGRRKAVPSESEPDVEGMLAALVAWAGLENINMHPLRRDIEKWFATYAPRQK